jgi:hypothetical protein
MLDRDKLTMDTTTMLINDFTYDIFTYMTKLNLGNITLIKQVASNKSCFLLIISLQNTQTL